MKNILIHPEPGKLHQRRKLAGVEVGSSWDSSAATTHHQGPSSRRREGLSEAEECGPGVSKRYLPGETPGHIMRATWGVEGRDTWMGWSSRWVSPGLQNPAPLHQQASSAAGTHSPAMKSSNYSKGATGDAGVGSLESPVANGQASALSTPPRPSEPWRLVSAKANRARAGAKGRSRVHTDNLWLGSQGSPAACPEASSEPALGGVICPLGFQREDERTPRKYC